ncbi:hypothetical protein CEP14_15850 [Cylindrospermopsis raciborskii C04]|uniref:Uncharacterized protein n=1 Tax=Cylindrospermopsis raciborskii C07 TaxID=2014886 RepID=A0ABX4WK34_9CYAN|nr:hypothetical protein [Cylindrospermopsis raciborskii]PNJ91888.1 hypothetical protein CEP14_15850 [Cylindrospermopsis raciborskii C04]PNJ92332.1 hypothetical protein CEP13_15235 [Cylindrospermopsis raciborskii C03]PNJ95437.1 hypothetical protein CEP15_11775 [Cylindrospermopsis raciborskii C07]
MVRQIAPKTQLGAIKSNKNQLGETIVPEIVYPESDGEPMADNTKQFTLNSDREALPAGDRPFTLRA